MKKHLSLDADMNIHIWNERTRLPIVEPLKPRFWVNSEIVYSLVVNNNKYLSYVDRYHIRIQHIRLHCIIVDTPFLGKYQNWLTFWSLATKIFLTYC